ncbi:hypothetical protein V2W45_1466632 [Cenococcum geophilum]
MEIFAVERLKIFTNCCNEGTDVPADCFRATCNPNVLYAYFACSIRNRLEVWKSDRFENPKRIRSKAPVHLSSDEPRAATVALAAGIRGRHSSEALELQISSQQHISEGTGRDAGSTAPRHTKSKNSASCWGWIKRKREAPLKFSKIWQVFGVDDRRPFNVPRPTKLVDGSRGGQAFMCELPRPKDNEVYMYPIEEQARMQLLSVLLVATLLIKDQDSEEWEEVLKEGFQLDNSLGTVFQRLFVELVIVNFFLICFIVSICYALWLCSLASWAYGATGLLMLGGNPRVKTNYKKGFPDRIEARLLEKIDVDGHDCLGIRDLDQAGDLGLHFGSLHGSVFTKDDGTCKVLGHIAKRVYSLDLELVRTTEWYLGIAWFALYLGISIMLQIAGTKVATVLLEVMAVVILILTSVFREGRMIPRWKAWPGAKCGALL